MQRKANYANYSLFRNNWHADVECQGQQFRHCLSAVIGCDAAGRPNESAKYSAEAFAPILFHGDTNAPGASATAPVGAAVLPRG
jgi:hypothetical protein